MEFETGLAIAVTMSIVGWWLIAELFIVCPFFDRFDSGWEKWFTVAANVNQGTENFNIVGRTISQILANIIFAGTTLVDIVYVGIKTAFTVQTGAKQTKSRKQQCTKTLEKVMQQYTEMINDLYLIAREDNTLKPKKVNITAHITRDRIDYFKWEDGKGGFGESPIDRFVWRKK